MAAAILLACESCGKSFPWNKHKSNRYCSMPCYRASQRAGAYKRGHGPDFPRAPCAHCGAMVERRPSQRRNGESSDKVFCDRKCYDAYRSAIRAGRARNCLNCGESFVRKAKSARYCSDACWKEHRKARPTNCLNCGCLFTPIKFMRATGRFIGTNHGKTCSAYCHNQWIRRNPERKRKIGDAFRGSNHPNWQGGKALLNNVSGRGSNWPAQRAKALKRDRYCCVDCGMAEEQCRQTYGRGLDVDHETPFHNFSNYRTANMLSNLRSRCASCHRIAEAKRSMVQMVLPMQTSSKRMHKGYRRGDNHPRALLTSAEVMAIRKQAAEGVKPAILSKRFGKPISHVCAIVQRKIWKSVP